MEKKQRGRPKKFKNKTKFLISMDQSVLSEIGEITKVTGLTTTEIIRKSIENFINGYRIDKKS